MPAGIPWSFCNTTMPTYVLWAGITVGAILFGNAIDQNERDRCSRFRDKSKMYGGFKKEGDQPSWGKVYKSWV